MDRKHYWTNLAMILCLTISTLNFTGLQQMVNDSSDFHELCTLEQEPLEVSKLVESPSNGTSMNYTWTSWVNATDNDKDLEVDTLNVYYNLTNFNESGYFGIEFLIDVYMDSDDSTFHIDYEWDQFYEYVEPNESYIWSYEWRAWEDGNYSMTIEQITWGDYNVTFIIQEEFSWINIHQFNLLSDYDVFLVVSNSDQDSFNDTIDLIYSLNFTSSGNYLLVLHVQIFYWVEIYQEWNYLTSDSSYENFEVGDGGVVNLTYQYKAWYDGDYQFRISIFDDFDDYNLLIKDDIREWYDAHAFSLVDEWNGVLIETDQDGDSCPDSFSLQYKLNFSYTGEVRLRISIEIMFREDSYWNYLTTLYDYYSDNVASGDEKIWDFEWKSWKTGQFIIAVKVTDFDTNRPIIEETFEDINLCAFEFINEWKGWSEELDRDQDGSIDSIRLNYGLMFKQAGWMDLRLEVRAEYWENSEYKNSRYYSTNFQGWVTTTSYYHCYYDFAAQEIGQYKISVSILTSDGFPILTDEEKKWTAQDRFNPLQSFTYSTSESDLDNDGLVDTLYINFEFKFSSAGYNSLTFDIGVKSFNTQLNDWDYEQGLYQQFFENVTEGEVYEHTLQYSAPFTADYMIEITIYNNYDTPDLFTDTFYWFGNKYTLFDDFYFSFIPEDSDSDGNNDSVIIEFNFKCTTDQNLLLAFTIDMKYYNDIEDKWDSDTSEYYLEILIFQQEVVNDTWYSWSSVWGVPFNGTFNISVSFSSPYFTLSDFVEYFLFENATKFDNVNFETEIWQTEHDISQDGFNDTTEVGLSFNFNQSGVVNLTVSIDVILVESLIDYTSWNIEHLMYQYLADVIAGTWYDWSSNLSFDSNFYSLYILRVLDRGVPVFYSLGYLFEQDAYTYIYSYPLLPVVPPEPVTTTTTRTSIPTNTTTTKISPGWHLAFSMLVITCLISLRRFKKSKK